MDGPSLDAAAALRLQVEWGADEALADLPWDRLTAPKPVPGLPTPILPAFVLPAAPAVHRQTPPPAAARAVPATGELRSLSDIHQALAAFEGCALRTTATTTVRPDGNPDAGAVLVAEAPGADDDRTGVAFSGAAGALLGRVLASAGLDRSALLLLQLVPWRPPGGRAPTDAEVQSCLPFLQRTLALVRPRRLVLLGAAPVKALAGTADSIRRLRGKWLDVNVHGLDSTVKALPLLPLDQWLRSATTKRDLWVDIIELRQSIDRQQ